MRKRVAGMATSNSRLLAHQTREGTRLNDAPAIATSGTAAHVGPNSVVSKR
jgi:hypothetical protein